MANKHTAFNFGARGEAYVPAVHDEQPRVVPQVKEDNFTYVPTWDQDRDSEDFYPL